MISAVKADSFLEHAGCHVIATVRKAVMRDIPAILGLINGYAARGVMLPRTEFELSESIRDFTVVLGGNELLGCGALHFYSPSVGEIRSLAVAKQARPTALDAGLSKPWSTRQTPTNSMPSSLSLMWLDFSTKLGLRLSNAECFL